MCVYQAVCYTVCGFQGNDLQGVKAYFNADLEGLYTLGTVVVDYRGYRITAQSIIPGEMAFYHMAKDTCIFNCTTLNNSLITYKDTVYLIFSISYI